MTRRSVGSKGDVRPRGNLMYADNPAASTQFALLADTARVQGTNPDGSAPAVYSASREEFIFYPGASAISGGMVGLSGSSRVGSGTITSSGSAAVAWGTEIIFAPLGRGKIDGVSTGGIISGTIVIGLVTSAATADATDVSFRLRNNPNASTGASTATYPFVTALAYTAGVACSTAEAYSTFEIAHLFTSASINAVPFGVSLGVMSSLASTNIIGRIMETSVIRGFIEIGT